MNLPFGLSGLPLGLLAAATIGLVLMRAMPRPGEPVLLVFPPGIGAAQALVGVLRAPGWQPLGAGRLGPLATARAIPAEGAAGLAALRGASGAWLILAAPGGAGCAPDRANPRGPRA
jgi:hypothetical protein